VTCVTAYLPSSGAAPLHHRIVAGRYRGAGLTVFCGRTGEDLATLPGAQQCCLTTYTLPGDGRPRIVSWAMGGALRVFDGEHYELLYQRQGEGEGAVGGVLTYYEPIAGWPRIVVRADLGTTLHVLDGESFEHLHSVEGFGERVRALRAYGWEGRQRLLVGGSEGRLVVYDPEAGLLLHDLQGHSGWVCALNCFESSSEPHRLVAVSSSKDGTTKVWDAEAGRLLHTLEGASSSVQVYKEHVGGRDRIVTATSSVLQVWDAETGTLVREVQGNGTGIGLLQVYQSAEGPWRLVSRSCDRGLQVWAPEEGRLLYPGVNSKRRVSVLGLKLVEAKEEGRYLLVAARSHGYVTVWDLGSLPLCSLVRNATKTGQSVHSTRAC
jgi:WD40 repeat protein